MQGPEPEPGGEDGPLAVPVPGLEPRRRPVQEGAAAAEAGHAAGGGTQAVRQAAQQTLRRQHGQQGVAGRVASLPRHAE